MQILTIVAMERPVSFSAEDVRDEKVKVLRAIKPVDYNETIIGQYSAANGKPGYKDDDTVPKDSVNPTFACTVLYVNNQRWEGVPFIMKAGKALNEQKTEVRIQYKDVTQGIFKDIARNELVIRVQPGEAVYLKMNTKAPGLEMKSVPTEMDLTYKRRFSDLNIPEAYEALILDAFKGDHSNFVRDDELDHSWKIWTPLCVFVPFCFVACALWFVYSELTIRICWLSYLLPAYRLHYIRDQKPTPVTYEYGSRGPKELDEFVKKYGGYSRTSEENYQWPVTSLNKI
jgi:glucose-6-phosphate 1-dehydrogenase